jgi:hypothetical protein
VCSTFVKIIEVYLFVVLQEQQIIKDEAKFTAGNEKKPQDSRVKPQL